MTIRLFDFNLCCFCFPLKTGVKIFGFVSVVGCLLNAFIAAVEIISITHLKDRRQPGPDYKAELDWFIAKLSVDAILQVVQITTSILLLLAVYQRKQRLIPPWLVSTFFIALSEIFLLPALPSRMVRIYRYLIANPVEFAVFKAVMIVDDVYGWLVVFSYYRSLTTQSPNVV